MDTTANVALCKIQANYLGRGDAKGLYGTGATDTDNIGVVMHQFDLQKKGIHGGGYDLLPRSLESVRDGYLDFAVDQQPCLQGFCTLIEMFVFKVSGGLTGPAIISTGLKFVTKDGGTAYLTTRTRFEGSSSEPQTVPPSGPIA